MWAWDCFVTYVYYHNRDVIRFHTKIPQIVATGGYKYVDDPESYSAVITVKQTQDHYPIQSAWVGDRWPGYYSHSGPVSECVTFRSNVRIGTYPNIVWGAAWFYPLRSHEEEIAGYVDDF